MKYEVNWRDYSYDPDEAAESIQAEMDALCNGQDPECLTPEEYEEWDALQSALWRAQDTAETAENIAEYANYNPYWDNGLSVHDFV